MFKFLGASRQKLDDRGRFYLPVRWAEEVEKARVMVLTAGPKGSLLLLERTVWEDHAQRLGTDLFCDARRSMLRALFVGHAEEVSVDKSSRVLIADSLRGYAKLDDLSAVFLVGLGNAIQIWPHQKWATERDSVADDMLFDLTQQAGPAVAPQSPETAPSNLTS